MKCVVRAVARIWTAAFKRSINIPEDIGDDLMTQNDDMAKEFMDQVDNAACIAQCLYQIYRCGQMGCWWRTSYK